MRLINIHTRQLEEFLGTNIPPYYILSHTWESDEISFQDYMWLLNYDAEVEEGIIDELMPKQRDRIQAKAKSLKDRSGYQKIDSFIELVCRFPRQEGGLRVWFSPLDLVDPEKSSTRSRNADHLSMNEAVATDVDYVWIDTCCINKDSSAELSEAINSMYMWYANSRLCIAFFPDVDGAEVDIGEGGFICETRWFTRGWTLQELLAPRIVLFYDKKWQYLTNRASAGSEIRRRTGMSWDYNGEPMMGVSISRRMSWAAARETTRVEDRAYCLMGIFGVNMPLLYGEGEQAFQRLQKEIASMSTDLSMFSWGYGMPPTISHPGRSHSMFAHSPAAFSAGGLFITSDNGSVPFTLTNVGIEVATTLVRPSLQERGCCNTFLVLEGVFFRGQAFGEYFPAIPVFGTAVDNIQLEDVINGAVVFRAFGHPVVLPKRVLEPEQRVKRRVVVSAKLPSLIIMPRLAFRDAVKLRFTADESINFERYEVWPNSVLYHQGSDQDFTILLDRRTDAIILRFADGVDLSPRKRTGRGSDPREQYAVVFCLSDYSRAKTSSWERPLVYRWKDFSYSTSSIACLMCYRPGLTDSAERRPSHEATTRYLATVRPVPYDVNSFQVLLSLAS